MSVLNPRLRIAVIGMGGIGSAFAFQLVRQGHHEVTSIARPKSVRLAQLQHDQGIVNSKGEVAETHVAEELDAQTPYDLVIVTLLAHQIDAVLPALQQSSAKTILFMFNIFNPERLQAILEARAAFGMPFIQAHIDKDSKLHATIGSMGQKCLLSTQTLVDTFVSAGLPAELEPNMLLWLRCHTPLCIAFESVSSAGMSRGGGASWGEAAILAKGVKECFALIRQQGHELYPATKARLNKAPIWMIAVILWFMSRIKSFRELLAGGANEARALVDVVVADARHAQLAVNVAAIEAMRPKE